MKRAHLLHVASLGAVAMLFAIALSPLTAGTKTARRPNIFASSKRCHVCGYIKEDLELSDREWKCPNCGAEHDRDENGAINIEMEGVRLLAGSGYIGVTPVEFAASALKIASTKVADCEAGTFYVFPRER